MTQTAPKTKSGFLENLHDQAKNPPGGDLVMSAFYEALIDTIQTDVRFEKFIFNILRKRKIVPTHFTNLIYRSYQYIELFVERNDRYPENPIYLTNDGWRQRILTLHSKYKSNIRKILLQNETATTIYQRYLGNKVVLNMMFPNKKDLLIADFGCGGNYGLPGLSLGIPFSKIVDNTPGSIVTKYGKKKINLGECLAVDKSDPDEIKRWREACSFYPQELKGRKSVLDLRKFEKKISKAKNVRFLKGDLLKLHVNHRQGTLPYKHFDAILINTILYQLTGQERSRVISAAKRCVKEDGVIIVQDFAKKDSNNPRLLDFDVSWFGKPGGYGTFVANKSTNWKFKHVFKWRNGRCTIVDPGPDINFLLKL